MELAEWIGVTLVTSVISALAALVGAREGGRATISAVEVAHEREAAESKRKLEDERRARALAFATEIHILGSRCAGRAKVLKTVAAQNGTLPKKVIKECVVGRGYLFESIGHEVGNLPPNMVERVISFYAHCAQVDSVLSFDEMKESFDAEAISQLASTLSELAGAAEGVSSALRKAIAP